MNFYRGLTAHAVLALFLGLSGCVALGPDPWPAPTRNDGVEGQWVDAQGVAISRFSQGSFESVASDTGRKLSEGTYHYRNSETIEISMTSLIRQAKTNVTCARVSPDQLNCTNEQGQTFIMTRRP